MSSEWMGFGLRWLALPALGTCVLLAWASGCSSGEDFTAASTGGSAGQGGAAGDASTSGGSGGTVATGGSAGTAGSGGTAGATSKPDGQSCSAEEECQSGICSDGFCCNEACEGTCESCAVLGNEGKCSAHPAGTDPGGECVGIGSATDPCAGKCDGNGSCEFPDSTKTCGASSCTAGKQTGLSCDGSGACQQFDVACGAFACGADACLASCASSTECADSAWCNAPTCESKKDDGKSCAATVECKSGLCEQGTCCNTACAAPFSCATGACLCGADTCVSGDACITWYEDKDGDGFGNPAIHKLGCSSLSPSGWSKNDKDCFDGNANAFPGQTKFFPGHRGDNKFDYDCDNVESHQYPNVSGKACGLCKPSGPGGCIASLCIGGWGCGACPSSGPPDGFIGNLGCGQQGTLQQCSASYISSVCNSLATTKPSTVQGCK